MPHHGNEEEHQNEEPVSFSDKRRIDPQTGQVRGGAGAAGQGPQGEQAPQQGQGPQGSDDDGAQAVSEAEHILQDAAQQGGVEQDSASEADSTGAGSDTEQELRNDLLRVQAEFVNYKRRVERDRNVAKDNGIQSVLMGLLPVLDDLDAARAAGDLGEGPLASIAGKLQQILEGFGLQRQDQESLAGAEFDPAQHEAVLRQPSDEVPADHIVQVFRNGYLRGDRVLRAAQVMVSAGTE